MIENPKRWPLELEGVEVVSARDYLTDPDAAARRGTAVYNLCRSYGYQKLGYYVSLLAEARGHRPLPSVSTLRSLSDDPVIRIVAYEIDDLIQAALAPLRSDRFELSVYFGRNLSPRYDRLSRALFNQLPAPFLRARFVREERWRLAGVRAIATREVPDAHMAFVLEQATAFFARPRLSRPRDAFRYDLAVLWQEAGSRGPSNERAIRKFEKAFNTEGIAVDIVGPDDIARIAEYDALFIRETTRVDHYTYRYASRAAAEGLVVVDDPESIIRCTNKVFQAELFERQGIPCPPTLVVHPDNVGEIARTVGLPCVLKKPDGAFSQGVVKVETDLELRERIEALFEESELVVAQAFTPSSFDWRVGVMDGDPLWACKYHMARGHWQIVREEGDNTRYGRVEALPWSAVPDRVVRLAVRAARAIGRGLYGVDVKQPDGEDRFLVMEVNDNPSIDAGYEDAVMKDELYAGVARWFRGRLDARGRRDGDP